MLSLACCDSGTEWRSGEYAVYWNDIPSNLELGRTTGNGAWIGRVSPRIIAVGANDHWIVAARQPNDDPKTTEYFIINISLDTPYKNGEDITEGPFDLAEFEDKKRSLELPEFTRQF